MRLLSRKRDHTDTTDATDHPSKRRATETPGHVRQFVAPATATRTTPTRVPDDGSFNHPLPWLRAVWDILPNDVKLTIPDGYAASDYVVAKGANVGKKQISWKKGDKPICGFAASYRAAGHPYQCTDTTCAGIREHDTKIFEEWLTANKTHWSSIKLNAPRAIAAGAAPKAPGKK